jgi:hypothetical protein
MKLIIMFSLLMTILNSGCVQKSKFDQAEATINEKIKIIDQITKTNIELSKIIQETEIKINDLIKERGRMEDGLGAVKTENKILKTNFENISKSILITNESFSTLKKENEKLKGVLIIFHTTSSSCLKELRRLESLFEDGVSDDDFISVHRDVKLKIEDNIGKLPDSIIRKSITDSIEAYGHLRIKIKERDEDMIKYINNYKQLSDSLTISQAKEYVEAIKEVKYEWKKHIDQIATDASVKVEIARRQFNLINKFINDFGLDIKNS